MKKLKRLKLHNAVVLNNIEMKNIVGGYSYGGNTYSGSAGPCPSGQKLFTCNVTMFNDKSTGYACGVTASSTETNVHRDLVWGGAYAGDEVWTDWSRELWDNSSVKCN